MRFAEQMAGIAFSVVATLAFLIRRPFHSQTHLLGRQRQWFGPLMSLPSPCIAASAASNYRLYD
jgi:hypothetical protein